MLAGYVFVSGLVNRLAVLEADNRTLKLSVELQQQTLDAQERAIQDQIAARDRVVATLEELNNVRSQIRAEIGNIDDPSDWQHRVDCLFAAASGAGDQNCSGGGAESSGNAAQAGAD